MSAFDVLIGILLGIPALLICIGVYDMWKDGEL